MSAQQINACIAAYFLAVALLCRSNPASASDLIYLLDEGLKQLTEIRAIQVEMEQPAWTAQSEEALRERERTLHQSEQSATSLLTLANATVHMLSYLTAEIVAPFVAPEFVERIAHMLDFYIAQLVGPKVAELKVHNPEKYQVCASSCGGLNLLFAWPLAIGFVAHLTPCFYVCMCALLVQFKPRELLLEIIGTWLHLAHDRTFLEKVTIPCDTHAVCLFGRRRPSERRRLVELTTLNSASNHYLFLSLSGLRTMLICNPRKGRVGRAVSEGGRTRLTASDQGCWQFGARQRLTISLYCVALFFFCFLLLRSQFLQARHLRQGCSHPSQARDHVGAFDRSLRVSDARAVAAQRDAPRARRHPRRRARRVR